MKLIRFLSKKLRETNDVISKLIIKDKKKQIMIANTNSSYANGSYANGSYAKEIWTKVFKWPVVSPYKIFIDTSTLRLGLENKILEIK